MGRPSVRSPLAALAQPGPTAGEPLDARHRPAPGWPDGGDGEPRFTGDTASVAVGPDGTVWVFHRGPVPVVQLDVAGRVLRSWGAGEFDRPHGITVDRFGDVYLVDEFGHVVQKRTPDGEPLLTLGRRGEAAPWQGGGMFNRPTSVAVHPRTGDLFVADGYGNSRVHRFDRRGEHLMSWGRPGGALGGFSLPHHVRVLDDDLVVVADRENFRLQFFDTDGEPRGQWHCHRPCAAVPMRYDGEDLLLVAELGPSGVQRDVRQLGTRLVAVDAAGRERFVLDRHADDQRLVAPHDVAVDEQGRIYLAEVARAWLAFTFDRTPDEAPVSVRRWDPVR